MGTSDDPMAVIDSQARIYGVQSLRVVDASSFPVLPPGHPSSTICKSSKFKARRQLCASNKRMMTDECDEIDALAEKIAADILSGR